MIHVTCLLNLSKELICADRQYFSTNYVLGTLTEVSINDSYVSMFWYK